LRTDAAGVTARRSRHPLAKLQNVNPSESLMKICKYLSIVLVKKPRNDEASEIFAWRSLRR
jgi:hypothetical protein